MRRLREWTLDFRYSLGPPPWYFQLAWRVVIALESALYRIYAITGIPMFARWWIAVQDARCAQQNIGTRWLWPFCEGDDWEFDSARGRWVRVK